MKPIKDYQKVLVRLPNALGDAIMATSSLRRLAAVFPPSALALLGPPAALDVLAGNPWVGETLRYEKKGRHAGVAGMARLVRDIRALKPDLAVIFPNSLRSALPFRLARVPERLGYFKEGRRILLTAGRPRRRDRAGKFLPHYTGLYFQELLDLFPDLPSAPLTPTLTVDPQGEREYAAWALAAGFAASKPLLIVAPGAAFGPSKIWIPERYAEVADELARRYGACVLLSYGPGEEAIAERVRNAMTTRVLPAAKLTLRGLKSIYARAAFVLTNDAGPRHLAVALGIPHVTIMGPNDPRYTDLPGENGEVAREPVACSPCQLKVCPLHEQVCMTRLTTRAVLDACVRRWPTTGR